MHINMHYLTESSEQNIISIQVPYTDQMTEEQISFIEDFVQGKLEEISGNKFNLMSSPSDIQRKDRDYSEYYISVEAQITYISESQISIVFDGLYNKKGAAHPVHWIFALNYDPSTNQRIYFKEKYSINSELYDIFANYAVENIKAENDGIWPHGWGAFSEELCSENAFIEGMKEESGFCYYINEAGVVISYPVPYALGDHKEVEIPEDKLTMM